MNTMLKEAEEYFKKISDPSSYTYGTSHSQEKLEEGEITKLIINFSFPGVKKENINLSIEYLNNIEFMNNQYMISAEIIKPIDDYPYPRKIINLVNGNLYDVNLVFAEMKEGLLTVTVPRKRIIRSCIKERRKIDII